MTGPGALYCWGSNEMGQVGATDLLDRSAPYAVTLSPTAPPSPLTDIVD